VSSDRLLCRSGRRSLDTERGLLPEPTDLTQLYTGHDYDRVTGQYYAPFRYLSPGTGRWLKQDPLGMIDGPNMYGYVLGNPVNRTDPLGLDSPSVDSLTQCATRDIRFLNSLIRDMKLSNNMFPFQRKKMADHFFKIQNKRNELWDEAHKLLIRQRDTRLMEKTARDQLDNQIKKKLSDLKKLEDLMEELEHLIKFLQS